MSFSKKSRKEGDPSQGEQRETLTNGFSDARKPFTTPDNTFLMLVASVKEHAQTGNTIELQKSATQALAIAKSEHWYRMQTIIYTVLGMSYMQNHDFSNALDVFKKSTSTAMLAKVSGDPLGPRIEIDAMFAEASALFAGGQHRKAAETYVAIVALTISMGSSLLTMEAWMMAAYCQEILGNVGLALVYGRMALDEADKIAPEKRPKGAIANLGASLLGLTDSALKIIEGKVLPTKSEIVDRMERLLGPEWQHQCIPVDSLFGRAYRLGMNDTEWKP